MYKYSIKSFDMLKKKAGTPARVYPASRPLKAGIGSSRPLQPNWKAAGIEDGWMDV